MERAYTRILISLSRILEIEKVYQEILNISSNITQVDIFWTGHDL